jgi:hypothetical protein
MTTGRINQVTTLANGQTAESRSRRLSSVTDRTRSIDNSRVVHLALPKPLSEPSSRECDSAPPCDGPHAISFFVSPSEHSLRGRNTQDCRVRKRTTRDRFDLSGTRTRKHRRGACYAGHAKPKSSVSQPGSCDVVDAKTDGE